MDILSMGIKKVRRGGLFQTFFDSGNPVYFLLSTAAFTEGARRYSSPRYSTAKMSVAPPGIGPAPRLP